MATLTEIDERPILGNGGTVTLYVEDWGGYMVDVVTPQGKQIIRWFTRDRSEALSYYKHPFADPMTPDVFARRMDEEE